MPFLITRGLGSNGDGTGNATLVTEGLGDPGESIIPLCHALQVLAVESFGSYLILSFSQNLIVDGPALDPTSWVIEPLVDAAPVRVLEVDHLGGPRLQLWVEEQTKDAIYVVRVPEVGIVDTTGNKINAPYEKTFRGFGEPVEVLMARSIDARTLEVIFSEAVVEADAMNVTNYEITPALQIKGVSKVTDSVYRLQTSRQTSLEDYTVAVENVRDLARNPQV